MNKLTGVLLAAGIGKRMGSLTLSHTKALLEIDGRSLMERMVAFMKAIGCEQIVVVGGFEFEKTKSKALAIDPKIVVVENKDYLLQNLISLRTAIPEMGAGDVLVFNADYVFTYDQAKDIKNNLGKLAVYASRDLSCPLTDTMRVMDDKEGNLVEMSKHIEKFNSIYTGIFYIQSDLVRSLPSEIEQILANNDPIKTTVEYLFPHWQNAGHKIVVGNLAKSDWLEIDTQEELKVAQEAVRTNPDNYF